MQNITKYKLIKDLPGIRAGTIVDTYKAGYFLRIKVKEGTDISIPVQDFDEWLGDKVPLSVHLLSEGDEVYSILSDGTIVTRHYYDDDNDVLETIDMGNAHVSKEEAIKDIKRRKAIQTIMYNIVTKNIDHTWDIDYEGALYGICQRQNGEYYVNTISCKKGEVLPYFKSKEDAVDIINNHTMLLNSIFNR